MRGLSDLTDSLARFLDGSVALLVKRAFAEGVAVGVLGLLALQSIFRRGGK